MIPADREALFHIARWTMEHKHFRVEMIRQLAGTEENYRFIIREIDRVKAQVHRARGMNAEATLTLFEWLTALELFHWHCAYCQSKPFQVMSHVVPLPVGGTTPENCVPACYSCNSKKKAKGHGHTHVQAYQAQIRQGLAHDDIDGSSHIL